MTLEKTREAARGRWRGILLHFGLDEKFLRNLHGPCPLCGGKDRYRWDDTNGDGGFYCSTCGPGSGIHLLMSHCHWDFSRAAKEVDRIIGNIPRADAPQERTEESKRDFMRRLYRESRPVVPGDPVHRYLTRRCGEPDGLLADIRFHPALRHSTAGSTHPAMIAMMGWDGKRFSGLHRTFLTEDGFKAAVDPVRMTYGDAGAVRLGPPAERLGIAEGIETAICACRLFNLPVWSGLCANGIKAWEPPEGVRQVVIFGDNDCNWVGQAAATERARQLVTRGFEVEVLIPPRPGTDWADEWIATQERVVA